MGDAFREALIAFAKSDVFAAGLITIFGALVAAVVGVFKWVQGHFAASAARQAMDHHGEYSRAAEEAARDELKRAPALLRGGNPALAAVNAIAKQRLVRASAAPPPIKRVEFTDDEEP
jgi:hypothetical protein